MCQCLPDSPLTRTKPSSRSRGFWRQPAERNPSPSLRAGLADDEARKLIREAIVRDHGAVDLYRFTSVLCTQLDQDGRKQIIEMLWEIAMADYVVREFESNLALIPAERNPAFMCGRVSS